MVPITVRLLRPEDTPAILEFEQINRAWFEQWVPPRIDAYFDAETLQNINADLFAESVAGTAYMHLILNADDEIVGRINLTNIEGTQAELGYRMAQSQTGRGIAVQAIYLVEGMAQNTYRIDTLHALCLENNPASAAVIDNRGFRENVANRRDIEWQGATTKMLHFSKNLRPL